ncbi:MAG: ASKHA domain-containing protein [Dethiobacteria bacterium]
MSPRVTILPEKTAIDVPSGTSLLRAAVLAGIDIKANCGGEGTCGRCRVKIKSGAVEGGADRSLKAKLREEGYLLSCQAIVKDEPVTIFVPETSRVQTHRVVSAHASKDEELVAKALLQGYRQEPICRKVRVKLEPPTLVENTADLTRLRLALKQELGFPLEEDKLQINISALRSLSETLRNNNWDVSVTLAMLDCYAEIIKVEPGENGASLGIAIDVGTTSNVVYLIDLSTFRIINRQGDYNKQCRYGDDVISRIIYSTEETNGLENLHNAVTDTLNSLIEKAVLEAGFKKEDIVQAVIAGNTTMTQLLWGVSPSYIRLEPYIPTYSVIPPVKAREIGLNLHHEAIAVSFPQVASYVGGDIVAGALFTRIAHKDETTLFIDIGTNGEMVLGNKDWLVSCACSAGPAFEGGGISYGMRATAGAIEKVDIDPLTYDVIITTVKDAPALGICGSGLIDALSALLDAGIIDRAGKFQRDLETPRMQQGEESMEYVLVWQKDSALDSDIVITEADVKNLLRAKAAIFAGMRTMLQMVEMKVEEIDKIIIAGGFGNFLNIEQAVKIGLLPDIDPERYTFIGNSSVKGACLALLSADAYREAVELGQKITYMELAVGNTFMDQYMSAMFLPHTDLTLFPSFNSGA